MSDMAYKIYKKLRYMNDCRIANQLKRKVKKADHSVYESMKGNIQFKNTHVGERCFILGSGPSLNDVDLKSLKDEFVFTVNNFSKIKNYEDVNTNVHLWMDPIFFGNRSADPTDTFIKMAKSKPLCFVPYYGANFIRDHKLHEQLDFHYLIPSGGAKSADEVKLDISNPCQGYYTVVQYGVHIALYMGFKEIYLLGCDMTGLQGLFEAATNSYQGNEHAYHDPSAFRDTQSLLENGRIGDTIWGHWNMFHSYGILYDYCQAHGITLINCSSRTAMNEVPRKPLSEVLSIKR